MQCFTTALYLSVFVPNKWFKFVVSCHVFHSSGRLREQRRNYEKASLHQGGWGGVRVRGGTLTSPQDASPGQAGTRPALPPAFPSALPAAAAETFQTGERSHSAPWTAGPCGELQLPAARAQPSVRNHSLIYRLRTKCQLGWRSSFSRSM